MNESLVRMWWKWLRCKCDDDVRESVRESARVVRCVSMNEKAPVLPQWASGWLQERIRLSPSRNDIPMLSARVLEPVNLGAASASASAKTSSYPTHLFGSGCRTQTLPLPLPKPCILRFSTLSQGKLRINGRQERGGWLRLTEGWARNMFLCVSIHFKTVS